MLIDKTIKDFLAELGSNSPAPGGGSVAALAGALGANLTTMVCRLTTGNEKYKDVEPEINRILISAEKLGNDLTNYIDKDTEAFNAVMTCFKMPKSTAEEKEKRSNSIQDATQKASILPLNVAKACTETMELAIKVLEIGNKNAASDATVSGLSAYAGVYGALYNVKINLDSIKDEKFKNEMLLEINNIRKTADKSYQSLVLKADTVIGKTSIVTK